MISPLKRHAARISPRPLTLLNLMSLVSLGAWGCLSYDHEGLPPPDGAAPPSPLFSGAAVGAACAADSDCRDGLACEASVCAPRGDTAESAPCLRSDECAEGLRCGWAGFCVPEGARAVGEACGHDGECERGVECLRIGGIGGQCVAREGGVEGLPLGATCSASDVCAEGLICSSERGECLPGSLLLNPDAFRGVPCDLEGDLALPFGVRHALPGSGADFFATPFPTDLRVTGGQLDLSDYPVPGAAFSDKDLFSALLREVESIRAGWSRNPGIYLRFTRPLSESSVSELVSKHLRLVDLTTGEDHPFTAELLSDRNKYICHNALHMHPLWSRPLAGGHTYAAIVKRNVRSANEEPPAQLDALPMLLSATSPSGDDRAMWLRYGPLRDWLRAEGARFTTEDIAGAAVFTVREETDLFERGREAVWRADVPRFDGAPVLCEEGVVSPCATPGYAPPPAAPTQRDPRDCPERPHAAYHELHARVRMPIFQRGTLPYATADGDVELEGGAPRLTKYMSMCMAITIPKTAPMPEGGWPVVIYGHGTGGRFRAGAQLLGAGLSSLMTDGAPSPVAIVAIDQSMHGPRLGDDQTLSPGPLFFNVQNPKAARGNLIQGALDNFALVRFLKESPSLRGLSVEGVGEVRFNPNRLSYHGHSQGGTTGPLFAPFEDELTGAAFSGTAGGLIFSLLGKKEPYDATVGLRLTLQELNIDATHPALHIFQELFDDVDPLNFANKLYTSPHGDPIHALHIIGLRDNFTPDDGQRGFASASGGLVGAPAGDDGFAERVGLAPLGLASGELPLMGNVRGVGAEPITGVVTAFSPARGEGGADAYDGHFVAYRDADANAQLLRFLGDLSLGRLPTVVEGAE